jgi:lipopolysaccharide assembly outer membrane protein LptD (OstA)
MGILLTSAFLLIAGCGNNPPKQPQRQPVQKTAVSVPHKAKKPTEVHETAKATFQKTKLIWSDPKGRSLFDAVCKSASVKNEENGIAELNGVTARLYRNGVFVSVLTAPRVTAWNNTRKISADGGVIVKSKTTGAIYRSDTLVWDSMKDKIIGTGNVKMTKQNMVVKANAFTSDTALENANFSEAKLNVK